MRQLAGETSKCRRLHSEAAHWSAAWKMTASLQLRVSRCSICFNVSMSISQKPSECKANWACASITSQHRDMSSGSSNRRDWLSSRQAFRAVKLVSKKVTHALAKCGTMYFLAAYRVARTVSASRTISSQYKYLNKQKILDKI